MPKSRVTFNYEAMKALNDDIQMRSDWLFPICSGPERLKDGEGRKAHPTQKPEALLHRVLLATTNPGDVVLDPVLRHRHDRRGGAAARPALARHRARSRSTPRPPRSASPRCGRCRRRRWRRPGRKRAEPRVPFGTIIELGILEPGITLTDERGRVRAEVKADGTLAVAGRQGSIHRLGARGAGQDRLQRLDLLALRGRGRAQAHRCAARGGAAPAGARSRARTRRHICGLIHLGVRTHKLNEKLG